MTQKIRNKCWWPLGLVSWLGRFMVRREGPTMCYVTVNIYYLKIQLNLVIVIGRCRGRWCVAENRKKLLSNDSYFIMNFFLY